MKKIASKYILIFLYLSILLRPILPAIVREVNGRQTDANNTQHSFFVHLLLKHIEKEKDKYPETIQNIIESSPLGLPDIFLLYKRPYTFVNNDKVVVECCLIIVDHSYPIFQPPEFI